MDELEDESGRILVIDRSLCEGNGRCEAVAPALFEVTADDDQTHFLVRQIGADLVPGADRAITECPRGALRWRQGALREVGE